MKRSVHLVIVEEDGNMLELLARTCENLGFRYSAVPGPAIRLGRVGAHIAKSLKDADAAIVASYFAGSRTQKGEEVVADIRKHCPELLIVACGGDDSHKKAMRKAGARGFAIRGMRSGVNEIFEHVQQLLDKAQPNSTTSTTPDQL